MFRIKKLDLFVLKSFGLLFICTFFICLFIFMMQFLWKYVDDMVGKGLEMSILAQFFIYAALYLVPASLPLAVLLAALITFGNFGERFELMAMKASGVSLLQIMRPLIVFIFLICCMSFVFQNVVGPYAQTKLWTLVMSMKQKSPELDIPEGAFYDQIPGYNLYVGEKNRDTGMLYDVMIYNFKNGFENAQIIKCDSARMEMTADKQHLYLHLFNGEEFENLRSQTVNQQNVPYRRETFERKDALIEFDSDFSMVDEGFMTNQSNSKNMKQLNEAVDSMKLVTDTMAMLNFDDAVVRIYKPVVSLDQQPAKLITSKTRAEAAEKDEAVEDSTAIDDEIKSVEEEAAQKARQQELIAKRERVMAAADTIHINLDSLFNSLDKVKRQSVLTEAIADMTNVENEWNNKSVNMKATMTSIRRHQAAWHEKMTLSLACLIFLFIGAPLGGIIRKGGLGMPVVISVIIFIFYYLLNNAGYKMARDGRWIIWTGMWMSTAVLAPIGAFLTYKSNNDSVVLNIDAYIAFFKKLLGIRTQRHLVQKEVIIEDPVYETLPNRLGELTMKCKAYALEKSLKRIPNYYKLWTNSQVDEEMESINEQLEALIEEMSNTRSPYLMNTLNKYPVISTNAHVRPFKKFWLNLLCGIIFPVGLFFFFRIWIFRLRLSKDLESVIVANEEATKVINSILAK